MMKITEQEALVLAECGAPIYVYDGFNIQYFLLGAAASVLRDSPGFFDRNGYDLLVEGEDCDD